MNAARAPTRRALVLGLAAAPLAACAVQSDYDSAAARLRRPLDDATADPIHELIRYATLAANSHNAQPWRFVRSADGLDIVPDLSRRTGAVDPDDHHLFASLGCAAETLSIAAPAQARQATLRFDAAAGRLNVAIEPTQVREDPLLGAITRRQCTRSTYDGRTVPAANLRMLQAAARMDGVEMILVTDRVQRAAVRDIVAAANRAQMQDAAFVAELKGWLRFNPEVALARADGLYSGCSGRPSAPTWLGRWLFDATFSERDETKRLIEQIDSSAGIAVFVGAAADAAHWVRAGRACQRFALQAETLGLKHAFVNQPVEVAALRDQFAAMLGLSGKRPDLVVRFGYARALPFSLRRPVEQVLFG